MCTEKKNKEEQRTTANDSERAEKNIKRCPFRPVDVYVKKGLAPSEQCVTDLCAWYDKAAHCCATLVIARALRDNK